MEVAAGDEETALAAVAELGERWATSRPSEVWRESGGLGVRVRTYAHVGAPVERMNEACPGGVE